MGNGADRVRALRKGIEMSPLGAKVADLLDAVWDGLYHLPASVIDRANWDDPHYVTAVVPDHMLSIWDSNHLTKLVVLCHDAALRLELSSANPRNIRVGFSQRTREASTMKGHPTLEVAADSIRQVYRHFLHEHTVPKPTAKRDPDHDCAIFEVGPPQGDCRMDGHYRCVECRHREAHHDGHAEVGR